MPGKQSEPADTQTEFRLISTSDRILYAILVELRRLKDSIGECVAQNRTLTEANTKPRRKRRQDR